MSNGEGPTSGEAVAALRPVPRASLRYVPWWLAASAAIHLALFWLCGRLEVFSGPSEPAVGVIPFTRADGISTRAAPDDLESLEPSDLERVDTALDLEPTEFRPDLLVEPIEVEEISEAEKLADSGSGEGPGGPGAGNGLVEPSWISADGAGAGGRASEIVGVGGPGRFGLGPGGGGGSAAFLTHVSRLRGTGVEVALCIDSTSSMWDVIDEVKVKMGAMITLVGTLVPSYRLGIVTYRDKDDEYLVKGEALSQSRYRLMNFMNDVVASGGGDLPEAVESGLEYCTQKLHWTASARKVIVLMGDAPSHDRDEARALSLARTFRGRGGVVFSIVTLKTTDRNDLGETDRKTIDFFRQVAKAGGGTCVFLDEQDALARSLLAFTFGPEWRGDVERLYDALPATEGQKDRMVKAKLRERDLPWLLRRLRDRNVYPGVVAAIVELHEPSSLSNLVDALSDAQLPAENRYAALYALRRITGQRIDHDPDDPTSTTEAAARALKQRLRLQ